MEQDAATDPPPPPTRMGRRGFLRLGLTGAAAACAAPVVPAPPKPGPSPRPPSPPVPPPLPPPPVDDPVETWIEPWVWRPGSWPGQQLHLNVVENENPGPVVGFGNPGAVLFSYGASTPGPTIRMKGDEILFVKLRNMLGPDAGLSGVGPNPDPNSLTPDLEAAVAAGKAAGRTALEVLGADIRHDFCIGEHTNGVHAAHVTNLHTHGLHVRPGRNPDGTHSDNVILRIIPQGDLAQREARADDPKCAFLREPGQVSFLTDDEQAGEGNYEFRLGHVQGRADQPHPPGTHWYHPHAHGSTHNQVASGMAGFLIVEGDVDEAVNRALTGSPVLADPEVADPGNFGYRERLMLIQRVFPGLQSGDPDADDGSLRAPPTPLTNGDADPKTIVMRPGAVERWRVLNGSVDGRGFKRFMVLRGRYGLADGAAGVAAGADAAAGGGRGGAGGSQGSVRGRVLTRLDVSGTPRPAGVADLERDRMPLWQLAMDGVTLVTPQGDYTIKDLSRQNAGTTNPLAAPGRPGENPNAVALRNLEGVYRNGASIRDCYVRPNEVYMAPANRADLFFKVPVDATPGTVFTVFARAVVVHADNRQQGLQKAVAEGQTAPLPGPEDIVVAYVVVAGDAVPGRDPYGPDLDVGRLRSVLPPAPAYLQPPADTELRVGAAEAAARGVAAGSFRTRSVQYSGWGSADYPLLRVPDDFVRAHPELANLVYAPVGGVQVLLAPAIRTMAVDGLKFNYTEETRPRMLLDTAEEWALYNRSSTLFGDTGAPPAWQYQAHYEGLPLSRAEGQARFTADPAFQIVTKAVDHPFHIHQNPFWVLRIEIPDENGHLVNILDEPRWQDVVWIPRNGGRVVFRSRFPDFVGTYVNHCHLLLHEDNGMMQAVEVTPFDDQSNYEARGRVSAAGMTPEEVSSVYPRPGLADMYQSNLGFRDTNPGTGQVYPGFPVPTPG